MAVPARRLRPAPPARRPGPPGRRSPSSGRRPAGRRTSIRRRPVRGRVPFGLFALLLVGALVVGLTVAQTLVSQTTFRIQELERQTVELDGEYDALRLRAARLSSPERISTAAHRAGLVVPERVEILVVPKAERRPGKEEERVLALSEDPG
jgi:cell division protein FtsL